MNKEEKRMMSEGESHPDIVKEGKAALFVLVAFIAAVVVIAVVVGALCLVNKIFHIC